MNPFGVITIFLVLYSILWVTLIVGMTLIRKGNKSAGRIRTWLLNKRIQQFQYPPFRTLLRLLIAKRFLPASTTFIFLIIIPVVSLFFALGMLLITPLLAIYQGFAVGLLIGRFDRKHIIWALTVGTFELGYWALSGALGMVVSTGFLFSDTSFSESFLNAVDVLFSGYWIPIVICILANALVETAGPIYWNMTGPISLEDISQGKYLNDDTQP